MHNSEELIKRITDSAQAIEEASVGVYMGTQDQALKDQMSIIEEKAKDIAAAIRSLAELLG